MITSVKVPLAVDVVEVFLGEDPGVRNRGRWSKHQLRESNTAIPAVSLDTEISSVRSYLVSGSMLKLNNKRGNPC